ncbi:DNA binding HTH domain protein [Vibrio phage 1.124.O._10N.286.49.B1]|nr:DNA binding HTH domain protein [Vibrio phage 1.124.O._10N.286.49.B1]
MKFTDTPTTTLDELLIKHRGNISHAALELGINRTTLRNYIAKKDKVLLVQIDGKLVPFVADRRQGAHKKESNNG